jgi:hypothetical protein
MNNETRSRLRSAPDGDLNVYGLSRSLCGLSNQSPVLTIAWSPAGRALNAPGLLV